MIHSQLKKVLNYRIGIEFELAGNFVRGYYLKYHPEIPIDYTRIGSDAIKDEITMHYGFKDFNPDTTSFKAETSESPSITEIRVSLEDYKSLVGLYNFMNDLNEFCIIHPNGGIHFHLDLTKYFSDSDTKNKHSWVQSNPYVSDCMGWVRNRLDRLGSIFPKYTGSYNQKNVAFKSKGNWVNFSRLKTMEVRIAPLTFEYTTIIRWIADLSKFRNEMLNSCGLSKSRGSVTKMGKIAKTEKSPGNTYNSLNSGRITIVNGQSSDWAITTGDDEVTTLNQYDERIDRLSRRIDDIRLQIDDLGTAVVHSYNSGWNYNGSYSNQWSA